MSDVNAAPAVPAEGTPVVEGMGVMGRQRGLSSIGIVLLVAIMKIGLV